MGPPRGRSDDCKGAISDGSTSFLARLANRARTPGSPLSKPGLRHRTGSSVATAQRACSATTGSGSSLSFFSVGTNFLSPLFPIAITAFLRRPESLARRIGDPRNTVRNSSCCISASQSRAGLTSPSRASNSGAEVAGALRFHGQTSWQMSHPKTWRPMPERIFVWNLAALFNGQVGDAQPGVQFAGRNNRLRWTGGDAAGAGPAAIGRRQVGARSSFVKSSEVRITPRNSHDPSCWLMMQVFLPIHPTPAYLA